MFGKIIFLLFSIVVVFIIPPIGALLFIGAILNLCGLAD